MKLPKKIIVLFVIVLFVSFVGILSTKVHIIEDEEIFKIVLNLSNEEKIKKANIKYGGEYCTVNGDMMGAIREGIIPFDGDEQHRTMGTTAMTEGRCGICFKYDTFGASNHPILCDDCKVATNRCDICGKKIKELE